MPLTLETVREACRALPNALAARYEDPALTQSWTVGRGKAFVVWVLVGDQIGPHLRSNAEPLRGDPRVKQSTFQSKRIEKTNNFIWLDPAASWSTEELEVAVAQSHALATRKDGGITRGGEFHDLYLAVRKALVATPATLRPPGPHHAGGPAAKILKTEGAFAAALALWAARSLASTVTEADRPLHTRLMNVLTGAAPTHAGLWAGTREAPSAALRAVNLAMAARGGMLSAPAYAADTVMVLHEHLQSTDPNRLTVFVADLDEKVLNAEFVAVAAEHSRRTDSPCERVLWRGSDAKGNAGRWVARLAPGRYVLIQKVGKRWEWIEGTRDDVLANVPDADFKNASTVALLRDQPGQFGSWEPLELR